MGFELKYACLASQGNKVLALACALFGAKALSQGCCFSLMDWNSGLRQIYTCGLFSSPMTQV
jgi:hypothetical protein